MISLRQTTAIRPAIRCRLAPTVMIFTGKFTGRRRYSEGDAAATQGEAEKNEDLNTGKNLVRFAHSYIHLIKLNTENFTGKIEKRTFNELRRIDRLSFHQNIWYKFQ